ncbi:hypothetical protein ALQ89_100905 [Pseudomonas amygdali pv. tabaci]|uniref:Uncharacterized protein n=2 Tax=Pseudomonas amygdali TaxID=47877 RepID=A0AAX1VYS8_PSEAJ|nr:hypothetical protein ALO35_102995 [Pseudomonas amygdali pv. lachrymans]KPY77510.1 hypothetical protein ALO60_102368 [Pseudomonas amygdali pv. tabaci]RML83241.1 hypothetical protein ALQ89_100905 [Pseudomonas amygdali pv. tabaci]RMR84916.1 hypothetical protein ALP77_102259 [Pseudomonas amygdali pv. tabaci]
MTTSLIAQLQTPWKHGLRRPRYSARFHTARVDSGLPSLAEIDPKLPIAKGSNRPEAVAFINVR